MVMAAISPFLLFQLFRIATIREMNSNSSVRNTKGTGTDPGTPIWAHRPIFPKMSTQGFQLMKILRIGSKSDSTQFALVESAGRYTAARTTLGLA